MNTIDIVILCILGIGLVQGFWKGFIKQLASLLGLVVGLLAAKALYASLAEKLYTTVTDSMSVAQGLAFVLIWLAVPIGFAIVASLLTKAMEAVALGGINRLLGAGLGLLKCALLVSLLIGIVEFVDSDHKLIEKKEKKASVLYEPMKSCAEIFVPVAKSAWEDFNI